MMPCCCCYWRADGRRLYRTELFCQRGCLKVFPNYCCPERWFGVNRISHPDWVKVCVELNYARNQNTKISSATTPFDKLRLIRLTLHCEPMSYIDQQGSSRGSNLTSPPLPFIPTLIGLRAIDLVSSLVWWEAQANKRQPQVDVRRE